MGQHSEAALNRKFCQFAKSLNLYLNHFPKHEKYGLCQQIRNAAYEVYGLIIEAQKRYRKKTTLTTLDIRHEQLRMYINLAYELGYFAHKDGKTSGYNPGELAEHRYLALSEHVDELGQMIGGWLKFVELTERNN